MQTVPIKRDGPNLYCRKTTVRVHSGVVEVNDFVKDRTVLVGDCRRRDRECRRQGKYVIRGRR